MQYNENNLQDLITDRQGVVLLRALCGMSTVYLCRSGRVFLY